MNKEELMEYIQYYKPKSLNYSPISLAAVLALGYKFAILGKDDIDSLPAGSLDILLVCEGITRPQFMEVSKKVK